jgi:threonine/homoserine/homoserine lactone efflux protein
MPEFSSLTLFFVAAVVLLITPGPAVIYIVTRSIDQGLRAGIVSVLGIAAGSIVHILAAAFGLSAILLSSVLAFSVVKYAGAAYLIYLGIRRLLERDGHVPAVATPPDSLKRIFVQGAIVNLLNPKSALFMFAFLPQFVDVAKGNVTGQLLFLGASFTTLAILSDSAYAVLAGTMRDWLRKHTGLIAAQRYVTGTVYILLGAMTAVSGSSRSK